MRADGQQHGTRGPGTGLGAAFLPVAAAAGMIVLLLWATGNLGALLVHGQRPRADLEEMGH